MARRVLILGGTAEASGLAAALASDGRTETIVSLAGRTASPRLPAGRTRSGGFGGVDGLARYLADESIDIVVDATHPFAARISANAAEAAARAGVPRLIVRRPQWTPQRGEHWREVASEADAAAVLPAGARAFLALGSQHLDAFSARTDVWFLVRVIDAPPAPLLPGPHLTVTGRGPFDVGSETILLQSHQISHVVVRNSGGEDGRAKLVAARMRAVPVIMIARPPRPPGPVAASVDDALAWLDGFMT